ncbi:hypothetical protein H310_06577 [Aphanomyces invadans]|uniref:Uncharacterized protein n=1 Tax=Aphanomyces invadans TaxID=157072 RepID=A0A024U3Z2_9STRA|nr:hypothetical protein H310_06577 [Aphanomyces invadans]ETW00920.1 hypothetical protein H310_06577 [Aphanomyces invadans]|eukprot:XP_008869918.1 hypothetical protein H310_06577 [Aphanomyces invadans]
MASRKLPIALTSIGTASMIAAFAITMRDIHALNLSTLRSTSLLNRFVDYQHVDVFETTLDDGHAIENVAQAFFQSPVFQAERAFLSLAGFGSVEDDTIDRTTFDVGDKVVVFRVVERTPGQILFCWNDFMDVNGHTWLSVADDGRTVQFGSTFDLVQALHPMALPFVKFIVVPMHLWYAQVVLASAKFVLQRKGKT